MEILQRESYSLQQIGATTVCALPKGSNLRKKFVTIRNRSATLLNRSGPSGSGSDVLAGTPCNVSEDVGIVAYSQSLSTAWV